jgi:hypothetical protein
MPSLGALRTAGVAASRPKHAIRRGGRFSSTAGSANGQWWTLARSRLGEFNPIDSVRFAVVQRPEIHAILKTMDNAAETIRELHRRATEALSQCHSAIRRVEGVLGEFRELKDGLARIANSLRALLPPRKDPR